MISESEATLAARNIEKRLRDQSEDPMWMVKFGIEHISSRDLIYEKFCEIKGIVCDWDTQWAWKHGPGRCMIKRWSHFSWYAVGPKQYVTFQEMIETDTSDQGPFGE